MKLFISDKQKRDTFIAIFQILKISTTLVSIMFYEDYVYMQGMDKSHVCLFDIKIEKQWFHNYELSNDDAKHISFDSSTLHSVLSISKDDQSIIIFFDGDSDKLNVELTSASKLNYDKFFSIPLSDVDSELLNIPDTEYDAEFSINSKKLCEITSQMILFGTDIKVACKYENIELSSEGELGKMSVLIAVDDLNEYSISEDKQIEVFYSLTFMQKMCLTTKLSIDVNISISNEFPIKIEYDLGNNSKFLFYLAPKANLS